MGETDRWCPNCQQQVRTKRTQKILPFISALLLLAVVPMVLEGFGQGAWVGQWWVNTLIWVNIGMATLAAIPVHRSCPICKTRNLEKQPPASTP